MNSQNIQLNPTERWRLLLGEASQTSLSSGISQGIDGLGVNDGGIGQQQLEQMDKALSWLYGRKENRTGQTFERFAGDQDSTLTTPDWINHIQTLFPKETIERLEKDALERYCLDDLVTSPEALKRATPNPTLLSAVLRTKHLMNPEVLAMARQLVASVVQQLMDNLEQDVIRSFSRSNKHIAYKKTGSYAQFAVKETVKRNLKHYQPQSKKLLVKQPWFYLTEKNNPKKWQIILVVDQSASMVSSVIHSAIMAACFWKLPNMQTHLLAFDTQVVDLTNEVADPVELLMQVQLGGGTDIASAMQYASDLITDTQRSMVVLVSDFYEGGNEDYLLHLINGLTTQGTKVLGLAALDENANPSYCLTTAQKMVDMGADVAAMTPGELANWMAEVIAS